MFPKKARSRNLLAFRLALSPIAPTFLVLAYGKRICHAVNVVFDKKGDRHRYDHMLPLDLSDAFACLMTNSE